MLSESGKYLRRCAFRPSNKGIAMFSTIDRPASLRSSPLPRLFGHRAGANPTPRPRHPLLLQRPHRPDYTLTANIGLFSQYGFRSIAQPAASQQSKADSTRAFERFLSRNLGVEHQLARGLGLYNRSSLEWDFYGGYKNTFPGSEDWGYDVGLITTSTRRKIPASSMPTRSKAMAPFRGNG
jgi:hypothetical protein